MTLRRTAARAALLPLAAGLLASCASHAAIPLHPAVPAALDAGLAPASLSAPAVMVPESTTSATIPLAPVDPDRQHPTDGVLLGIKREVPVHAEPGDSAFARLPARQLGVPTWVPMIERRGDWARVLLPSRPNGSAGWINAGDAKAVKAAATPYRIDVDVAARRLSVREGDREIGSWAVGVGADRTPTPRGRTFLVAVKGEAGSASLALGAHSETRTGPIELRGEPDPKAFGAASSDGAVQVPEAALQVLQRLPLGTLVLVH
jgi:hypothetical protein